MKKYYQKYYGIYNDVRSRVSSFDHMRLLQLINKK